MERVEVSIIQGSEGKGEVIQLSPLDLLTGHFSVRGVYVYPQAPNIQAMKESLKVALDYYPEFGGSLYCEKKQCYLKLDNQGVRFSVYTCTSNWGGGRDYIPVTEDSLLIDPFVVPQQVFAGDEPLNAFKVTLFNDGYWTLAVRSIHSQADGAAYGAFLVCWSQLYSGECPRVTVRFPRSLIRSLAQGSGYQPSARFKILPAMNFDLVEAVITRKAGQGIAEIRLPISGFKALHILCCQRSGTKLSSSDLLHAMGWKAFAISTKLSQQKYCTLYSIFDLRSAPDLSIPVDFRGNAVIERHVSLTVESLRYYDLDDLALYFRRHMKPLHRDDVAADIAYLEREQALGHIDEELGRYDHFTRGSVVDCLEGTGLYVNDMRYLNIQKIIFEQSPCWFETVITLGFNFLGFYQHPTGDIVVRYVGDKTTLDDFKNELLSLLKDELIDEGFLTALTDPWAVN